MLAIVLLGVGTYLTRALFIVALAGRRFSPAVLRTLEYVAPSVLAALVASLLLSPDGRWLAGPGHYLGLAAASVTMAISGRALLSLAVGLAAFSLGAFLPG